VADRDCSAATAIMGKKSEDNSMVAASIAQVPRPTELEPLIPLDRAKKNEIRPLTGLRFIAAFSILIGHSTSWVAPFSDSSAIARYGDVPAIYGMPLFFVLSGFVIHYTYGHLFSTTSLGSASFSFLSARFARLYPLFLFFFFVGVVVDFTFHWIPEYPLPFLAFVFHFLTLTQSWFYITFFNRDILNNGFGLSWSISTEVFFYIFYVFFVFILLRIKTPRTTVLAMSALSAAVLAIMIISRTYMHNIEAIASRYVDNFIYADDNWNMSFIRWLFYYSPYVRIFEFILGCFAAQLYLLLQAREVSAREHQVGTIALSLACAALILFGWLYATGGPTAALNAYVNFLTLTFGCAAPIAVVIFCVSRYETSLSRAIGSGLLVAGGEISYSIYAVHTWTLRIFVREPVSFSWVFGADALLRIAIAIVFTLIVATATYRLIERPWRDRLRAISSRVHSAHFSPRAAGAEPSRMTPFAIGGMAVFLCLCLAYQLFTSYMTYHLRHTA
jgi:peptidoglycan/LPS O-acetylase OafA/YrhL